MISAVSCSESGENNTDISESVSESESTSQHPKRISSSPINPDIIGTWFGETNGYIFQEDRKVSLYMDFSSTLHFEENGSFMMQDKEITSENISYDGSVISVMYNVEVSDGMDIYEVVHLERTGEPDTESMDGEYTLTSGAYLKIISEFFGMNPEKANIKADIEGEKMYITVVDYCDYETLGNSLELFSEDMQYIDETASAVKYTFEIDGDTLTLTYQTGEQEILKRQEEKVNE